MPDYWSQGKGRGGPVQGAARGVLVSAASCWLLAGCGGTLNGPINLFHDLEGGEIAANRPPPPAEGQPYPKLGTVPPKPVVADSAYRTALSTQLVAERDRTERVAADTPIEAVPPPPPPEASVVAIPQPSAPPPTGLPAAPQGGDTAAQGGTATALLDTAEAPPPAPATLPRTAPTASPAGAAADVGPPPGTPVTVAGAPADPSGLPDMPATPPAPATFEGVAAEPAPSIRRLPAHLPPLPSGTPVFFPPASAVLPPSQTQALRDFLAHRAGRGVEILGQGDASADSPDGQATAIALGLSRAHAVATALEALHVPQSSLRLGADAFGRGAVLRLLP